MAALPRCAFCGSDRIRPRRDGENRETEVFLLGPVWLMPFVDLIDRKKTLICDRCGTPLRPPRGYQAADGNGHRNLPTGGHEVHDGGHTRDHGGRSEPPIDPARSETGNAETE